MIKRICGNCWHWNPDKPEKAICRKCGECRKNFFPRELTCTICEAQMILYKYEYAQCPDCGSQFWPFIAESNLIREEFERQLPAMRSHDVSSGVLNTKSSKCGGSKNSKGHSKREKMNKKTPKQIYNILSTDKMG